MEHHGRSAGERCTQTEGEGGAVKEAVLPMGSAPVDLTIFVPCYNEEQNVVATLDTICSALAEVSLSWEILVIDDASRDGTVACVRRYMEAHPGHRIDLKIREVNVGLAQNYIEGAFLGCGRYYKLVSGDNAEPHETLVTVFRHIGEADMVLPYFVTITGRKWMRKSLSCFYTFLVNAISGHRIRYYNGGAVHLRYNVMRWHTNYHGFSFQADIITRLLDQGMSYVEIPVISQNRTAGVSKALTLKNFLSVAHFLFDLTLRRIGRSSRHRVAPLR
jgi:glycosyltransferase involved in cell wall biosynthesis